MQDQRSSTIPSECMRPVEAAVLALLLAEDWPWLPGELPAFAPPRRPHRRLRGDPAADGLVVARDGGLRASWTAVRGDELAGWGDSIKRRARMQLFGAAIPLH
jgi:hypothetical protein